MVKKVAGSKIGEIKMHKHILHDPYLVAPMIGLVGSASGLTKSATWTWSVHDSIENKDIHRSVFFNGNVVGIGGMDHGYIPSDSKIYIYALSNRYGNIGVLGTTFNYGSQYAGSHRPAGYDRSVYISTVETDSTGCIIEFIQHARVVSNCGEIYDMNRVGALT